LAYRQHPCENILYITILANLIAQGTNLGIAAMSNSVDNLSADMLQHVNQWFFSLESHKAANKVLVDFHHSLQMSGLYGTGEMSWFRAQVRHYIKAKHLIDRRRINHTKDYTPPGLAV
jgi:hypothetical protein